MFHKIIVVLFEILSSLSICLKNINLCLFIVRKTFRWNKERYVFHRTRTFYDGACSESSTLLYINTIGETMNYETHYIAFSSCEKDNRICATRAYRIRMYAVSAILASAFVLFMPELLRGEVADTDLNELSERQNAIKINKCCDKRALMVDAVCRQAERYNLSLWEPTFKNEEGKTVQLKYYKYVIGIPDCKGTQTQNIYIFKNSEDKIHLLADGHMQHLIHHENKPDSTSQELLDNQHFSLHAPIPIPVENVPLSYIYEQGKYCMDKIYMTKTNETTEYALVCVPEVKINWRDTDFIMRMILNPIFHGISMILYLLIAIIYFILPTLRDLAGNIITTINFCLIISQAADLVKVFTVFSHHVSFMIADIILYVSLLGAFFWLNSFGFYIWKTFKSRNVFLRVTDVRKYCYYSCTVWSTTILMAVLAIAAHFLLDISNNPNRKTKTHFSSSIILDDFEQETIGWLGIAIFFVPIAFTIALNIFFYVTTRNVIKRINVYGRIHYKLRGCFDLFLQLFLIMTISWLFLLLASLEYDGLIYAHIVVNLFQGILIFYVCIVKQSHITFLLRKSCFYAEPVPTGEWGDEMTHVNGGNY